MRIAFISLTLALLSLSGLTSPVGAQPQIAYIIPDIGAENMNTAVEIVARHDANGTFGTDGLYLNITGDAVRVEPTGSRAADLIVGPVVVSWNGRLISTQVFVRPNAPTGIIPLRVTAPTGQASVNFEIVTPIPSMINPPAGALGGGGALGTRSKRGAMIVESLVLTNGTPTYTVSTNDPDAGTAGAPGNQGYLPLIIIARQTVTLGAVTVNASGSGKNGGPGGGGGGGKTCDSQPLGGGDEGTAGGDGYAAGGGGGRNGAGSFAGTSDNRFKSVGVGTAGAGGSLSGVAAGLGSADCTNPEGTGGGTGHSFGRSGQNHCVGNMGFYGGAASGASDAGGGGGGYAADGSNAIGGSTGSTRGQRHGNQHVVPIAGGSGGAGGNPGGFPGRCAGEGGGGGGAIAIYSMDFFTSQGSFLAQGGAGTNGDGNADGGGGSGGAIIIGAKGMTNQIRSIGQHNVAGGSGPGGGGDGAAGRFRYDGFHLNPPTTATTGASTYTGPSTDTLTYVEGYDFTLRGTRAANQPIRVYMRSATGSWNQEGTPTYNGREWTLDITAADTGYHYIVALQQGSNVDGPYTDEPQWVNSQVAANVVRIASVPRIETDLIYGGFGPRQCLTPTLQPILYFWSVGQAELNVRVEMRNESAPGVFSAVAPAGISSTSGVDFPPTSTDTINIKVIGVLAAPPAKGVTYTAEMLIITNDPRTGFDTIIVPLSVRVYNNSVRFQQDTVDFGRVCLGQKKDTVAQVLYAGESIQYNADINPPVNNPSAPFYRSSATNTALQFKNPLRDPNYDSVFNAGIGFSPTKIGAFADSMVIVDECGDTSVVYLKGEGVEARLSLSGAPAGFLNFGPVLVGNTQQGSIWIRNTGDSPVTLGNGTLVPPPGGPFRVVSPNPINGVTIVPGDSLEVVFDFTPDTTRLYSGTYKIDVQGPCADVDSIVLNGQGVEICFSSSLDSITLIADSCDANPDPLRVVSLLENCGGVPIDILDIFSVGGKLIDSALSGGFPFRMGTANVNEKRENLILRWNPADGIGVDSVGIVWRDINGEIQDTLYITARLLFDRAIVNLKTTDSDTIPSVFDIGGVYQCGPAQDTLVLENVGDIEGEITGSWAIGGIFDIDPSFATPYLLAEGEEKELVITLDPANAPTPGNVYIDTLILVNGRCNQEWRVALRATRYQLEVNVPSIDFGATNLGLPRTQTVTFRNTTDALPSEELTIERIYIDPPGASPPFAVDSSADLPHQVQADSGSTNVKVSFTPDAEQVYNGRLCFEISYPCDTVICVDLTGEGIRSNIYVPQGDLSFGEVYYCAEDTLGLTIFSVGPVELEVDSIRIIGPDAPGFEIVSISKPLPTTLLDGFPTVVDSINVLVRFIPANVPPDGVKSATLEIYSNDSAQGLVSIPLSGERTSPSIVGPGLVDFGTVVVNGSSLQRVTLTNTSDDPITIASPLLNPPFRIVTPTPLVIPARGSLQVDVEFAPDDSQVYNDTIIGTFLLPCPGEFRVPLTGEGLRGETVISIPGDLSGDPGERILVPIVLQEATALADVGATTLRAWIRFNKSMLLPIDAAGSDDVTAKRTASNGTIISDRIEGDERVLEVEFTNDPLPTAPAPLGFVDMIVLLGDDLTTDLRFDSVRWTDGEVASQTVDGAFELTGYCDVGGNRLIRVDGEFGIRAVAPNPIGSSAEILFETVENGPTRLEVFDMAGRLVATLLDVADLPVQAHVVEFRTDGIASGGYNVVLTTRTQRSVVGVVVGK